MSSGPLFSIVITTRNRKDELRRALESCFAQDFKNIEVLVYDDASEDGTAEVVETEFPGVRVFRRLTQEGLIVRRNEALRDSIAPWIISLDDDAYFTSADTLRQISLLVDSCEKTAVWGLAYCEPLTSGTRMKNLPSGSPLSIYKGGVHAIRRQAALDLGGYPELLVHQGEERDLSIRLHQAGWNIRYAATPPIIHLCSAQRDPNRIHYYGYRNTILFSWMRIPFPQMLWRMAGNSFSLLMHRLHWSNLCSKLFALGAGYFSCIRFWSFRAPVNQEACQKYLSLPHHGPCTITGIDENTIPAAACRLRDNKINQST